MTKKVAKNKKATRRFKLIEKLYSYYIKLGSVIVWLFSLLMAVFIILGIKSHTLPFIEGVLLLLFFALFPFIDWLFYYGKNLDPEKKNKLVFISFSILFFIGGLSPLLLAEKIELPNIIISLISFICSFLIILVSRLKTTAWRATSTGKEKGTFKGVYFKGLISKKYSRTLLNEEIIFIVILLIGLVLRYFFNLEILGILFIFFGIFGILGSPIWALLTPPPAFLSKNQKQLRGEIYKNEKFLGAVYGSYFMMPGASLEEPGNSLFVTNRHLLCITQNLKFVESTDPLYKTKKFDYYLKKGTELLKRPPKDVLNSHSFNFSLDFDNIKKIFLVSNFLFKLMGFNIIIVKTNEGNYTFTISYADQFEELRKILNQAIPNKISEKFLF